MTTTIIPNKNSFSFRKLEIEKSSKIVRWNLRRRYTFAT